VNEDGTLNLRVFNRENDINYIGQGVGYTQGVGMSYEVDFDNLKELLNKIFKRVPKNELQLYPEYEDDNYLPENIRMQTVKSRKETTPKTEEKSNPNREAKPDDE
jgi:asparagine synthetase A